MGFSCIDYQLLINLITISLLLTLIEENVLYSKFHGRVVR